MNPDRGVKHNRWWVEWITAALVSAALITAAALYPLHRVTDEVSSGPAPACHRVPADTAGSLRVLAGSELKDLKGPVLDRVRAQTGVQVVLTEVGTLAGVDQIVSGKVAKDKNYDAIWFSTNGYLRLHPQGRAQLIAEREVMRSPIILALTEKAAARLQWTRDPTWTQIAQAGAQRRFTFGMTEPASSNSGFSALLALTTALAGTGGTITEADVHRAEAQLRGFFQAQELFEGSSGWLSDVYAKTGYARVDGLFNYESELLKLQDAADRSAGKLPKLKLFYPQDGVVMADYPLSLLASADAPAQERYRAVVDCLLDVDTQRLIMEKTRRRPVSRGVPGAETFQISKLYLLHRPGRLAVVDTLLKTFKNELRRPANVIYVLDTSGSMGKATATGTPGEQVPKIDQLRNAFKALTGTDNSVSGRLSTFNARENVTLLPFNSSVGLAQSFPLPAGDPGSVLKQIWEAADALRAKGETVLYDALETAYLKAQEQITADRSRFTTIVLLTDGARSQGQTWCQFRDFHDRLLDEQVRRVRVHVVFLRSQQQEPVASDGPPCTTTGSHEDDMKQLANFTGGRFFDTDKASLADLFKEIRGYQ